MEELGVVPQMECSLTDDKLLEKTILISELLLTVSRL